MKNIDKNLKDLISDIDSVLKEYDLEGYAIDRIYLMPIGDEFDKGQKEPKEGNSYEVKRMSHEKLKIEKTNPKKK